MVSEIEHGGRGRSAAEQAWTDADRRDDGQESGVLLSSMTTGDRQMPVQKLTSGNVPLLKTLQEERKSQRRWSQGQAMVVDRRRINLHEEARLSAGAVANDDEFATQLSHGAAIGRSCWSNVGWRRIGVLKGSPGGKRWMEVGL